MNKPLIYEPMTAFTDLLIFGLGLYYARELYGIYSTKLYDVQFYFMLGFFIHGAGRIIWRIISRYRPSFY